MEIARTKNSQPLPLISDKSGLRLPPERYCLTSSNYRVKTIKKVHTYVNAFRVLITILKTFLSMVNASKNGTAHIAGEIGAYVFSNFTLSN